MSIWKVSGGCALISVLSLSWAFLRGDFMCASTFTAALVWLSLAFGVATIIGVIAGLIGLLRSSDTELSSI